MGETDFDGPVEGEERRKMTKTVLLIVDDSGSMRGKWRAIQTQVDQMDLTKHRVHVVYTDTSMRGQDIFLPGEPVNIRESVGSGGATGSPFAGIRFAKVMRVGHDAPAVYFTDEDGSHDSPEITVRVVL